jgi:hypothetical protein
MAAIAIAAGPRIPKTNMRTDKRIPSAYLARRYVLHECIARVIRAELDYVARVIDLQAPREARFDLPVGLSLVNALYASRRIGIGGPQRSQQQVLKQPHIWRSG